MIHLDVPCWKSEPADDLTVEQATEVASAGLVDVLARPQTAGWMLAADSRVGVATGNGWDLRVRPRLAVPQLFFLLAYANDPKGWKDLLAPFEREDDLLAAVAHGFSWHALRAVERGLLRGYVHIDDRLSTIRGRIRFGDQIARSVTLPLPVEVSYDEYTADVIENQLLKTATALLMRFPRVPARARKRLLRLRALFDEIAVVDRPREVKAPPITRINQRYEPALRLTELILRNSSITTARGGYSATGFSFDMNRVFEDFVTTAFTESMRRHGGRVQAQVHENSLDGGFKLRLKPDISWWIGNSCMAILDAKYKAIEHGRMRHPDAYQMLAYCTAYNLRRGYLLYADDTAVGSTTHVVRNSGIEIVVVELSVQSERDALLRQVDELADDVVRHAVAISDSPIDRERSRRAVHPPRGLV